MNEILLLTPPFTQLNTPYPATAYIKGFLNSKKITSFQADLGIEVILDLFSQKGLKEIFSLDFGSFKMSDNAKRIYHLKDSYISTIDSIILFLQGKQPNLARQIASENYLPQANRFKQLDDLDWAFGAMGIQDKAKYLATMYLEDISDFIVECIDSHFGFSRYAEKLGMSANTFDEIYQSLLEPLTLVDRLTINRLDNLCEEHAPSLVCLSVPFPGNLYSALRCAQFIKDKYPKIKIVMGGGFPNTELRSLKEPRVFEFVDYICLDDGELPLELVIQDVFRFNKNSDDSEPSFLKRTFILENDKVFYNNLSLRKDYPQAELGTPDYTDLWLDQYISVIELANPMHALWSDGRWNKLTMAHGCYWGKCTFCDVSLAYIGNYEPLTAKLLVDRMSEIIEKTGEHGFHFVDEAAPPALMRELAIEILRRGLKVSWWTNIRFEKAFTADLCRLLQESGCIAVSGGLEVASDRLLKIIEKGVTVQQVAKVTKNFTENGMMVHAYLMYGYPTQTIQETIDSLEMVRQLFELGVLESGFWHRFALTAHSPIGLNPDAYGITPYEQEIEFAHNEIPFEDSTNIEHEKFSFGLKKSIFNFMHGIGLEDDVRDWFDFRVPPTSIAPNYIETSLELDSYPITKASAKLVWIGNYSVNLDEEENQAKTKISLLSKYDQDIITLESSKASWLIEQFNTTLNGYSKFQFQDFKNSYQEKWDGFDLFWYSEEMDTLRAYGLLQL